MSSRIPGQVELPGGTALEAAAEGCSCGAHGWASGYCVFIQLQAVTHLSSKSLWGFSTQLHLLESFGPWGTMFLCIYQRFQSRHHTLLTASHSLFLSQRPNSRAPSYTSLSLSSPTLLSHPCRIWRFLSQCFISLCLECSCSFQHWAIFFYFCQISPAHSLVTCRITLNILPIKNNTLSSIDLLGSMLGTAKAQLWVIIGSVLAAQPSFSSAIPLLCSGHGELSSALPCISTRRLLLTMYLML